jgi:hypothetical protein
MSMTSGSQWMVVAGATFAAAIWCGWGSAGISQPVNAMADSSSLSRVEQPPDYSDIPNPHSDLIFRATEAMSCLDCHRANRAGEPSAQVQDNELVRGLKAKAKGIHGPGRFADCLRCHAGGDKGVEKYRNR